MDERDPKKLVVRCRRLALDMDDAIGKEMLLTVAARLERLAGPGIWRSRLAK